ncbi:unnamed protein product [Caenorhabditis nigoni]
MGSTRKSTRRGLQASAAPVKPVRTGQPRLKVKNARLLKREVSNADDYFDDVTSPLEKSTYFDDDVSLETTTVGRINEQSTSSQIFFPEFQSNATNSNSTYPVPLPFPIPHNYVPPYPIDPINSIRSSSAYVACSDESVIDQLQSCVVNTVLDLYQAGKVIHEAYSRRQSKIDEECKIFALKNSKKVSTFTMPPPTCYSDPNIHFILLQGQLIYSLLSKHSVPATAVMSSESEREYKRLPFYGKWCYFSDEAPTITFSFICSIFGSSIEIGKHSNGQEIYESSAHSAKNLPFPTLV